MKSLSLMTTHKTDTKQQLQARLEELNQFKIDLGLERLSTVYQRLNLNTFKPTIITVGGTNGKGSTVAALCALLDTKEQTFGAFTSPHIHQFNERININGEQATDAEILNAFDAIDKAKAEINLSYFEYAFLSAMIIFQQHQVNHVVLEVGLGGRLDAVNVVDADVAIITTVALDHTEWLGDDIASIAKEKAGIMRSEQTVVYGDSNIPQAILEQAQQLGSKLLTLGSDYQIQQTGKAFTYETSSKQFVDLPLPLLKGDWQLRNFSGALTALLSLGYEFTDTELKRALSNWQIPGRLQVIKQQPLVLADVAHNQQAVQNLAKWLADNPIQGHTRAVFSVLADKNMADWISAMDALVDHWFVFELENQRAMPINELKITLADHVSLISVFDTGSQAYEMAQKVSNPADRIIVFGSFHVLDEVLKEA